MAFLLCILNMPLSVTLRSHLMNFFCYTSSAATPFYEELARLTRGHYLKLDELEHIVNLMECVMHRARSVEHVEVRIKYLQTAVILVFTD